MFLHLSVRSPGGGVPPVQGRGYPKSCHWHYSKSYPGGGGVPCSPVTGSVEGGYSRTGVLPLPGQMYPHPWTWERVLASQRAARLLRSLRRTVLFCHGLAHRRIKFNRSVIEVSCLEMSDQLPGKLSHQSIRPKTISLGSFVWGHILSYGLILTQNISLRHPKMKLDIWINIKISVPFLKSAKYLGETITNFVLF